MSGFFFLSFFFLKLRLFNLKECLFLAPSFVFWKVWSFQQKNNSAIHTHISSTQIHLLFTLTSLLSALSFTNFLLRTKPFSCTIWLARYNTYRVTITLELQSGRHLDSRVFSEIQLTWLLIFFPMSQGLSAFAKPRLLLWVFCLFVLLLCLFRMSLNVGMSDSSWLDLGSRSGHCPLSASHQGPMMLGHALIKQC